jgi:predicted metal-dependent hydrolase
MQRLSIKTPSGPLEYTITHRPRVTKRLHMELDEKGGLVVVAPRHWSKRHVNATLSQNTYRVERFLVRARQQQLAPLKYIHGEEHLYLGRPYPLLISAVEDRQTNVVFTAQEFRIEIRKDSKADIRTVLQDWYRQQAQRVLTERFQLVKQRVPWAKDRSVPLKLRKMKRTWGNCSSKGLIKLNTHLIKAELPVIDSVIAHELCHLEEMNHGKKFYMLLESLNPDWRRDRNHLRAEGNVYLL